jgi:aspartyl-tRNA(Asn)/glutamyl-tRNA(Gln) amidotransferase subunit A
MWTIHAAADAIRRRELSPVTLLDECLARIDRHESNVRAWVFVAREEARAQAERLAQELKNGQCRGSLHGIPIGVKDIFDVFDWPTAAGSKLWVNSIARRDCPVVERLRQAGAIILGKTVTTAYASFDPPPTRNPWNAARTPGGSSSGSAAAVACGMCLGALASQTGGSITRPAAFCGVSSVKPTYGRVSAEGVVPLAPSMDHVGVMANCIRDVAILLGAIGDSFPTFSVQSAMTEPEQPPCLGRLGGLFTERAEPVMRSAFIAAMRKLEAAGATLLDLDPPAAFCEVLQRHQTVMAVEAAEVHEQRIRRHAEDYPPRITSLIEEGFRTSATEYVRCLHHKDTLSDSLVEQLELSEAHAFVTPAALGPAPGAETTGNPAFNSPWSYTGLPVVSLPIGWTEDGLPLSLQLTGDRFREEDLLRWSAWCERVIGFERRDLGE